MEGTCSHDRHRCVYQTRDSHGYSDIKKLKPVKTAELFRLAHYNPALSKGRVEENHVWHDCSPEYTGRQQDALRPGKARDKSMMHDQPPVGAVKNSFNNVSKSDHTNHRSDQAFERAESVSIQSPDDKGGQPRQDRPPDERHVE